MFFFYKPHRRTTTRLCPSPFQRPLLAILLVLLLVVSAEDEQQQDSSSSSSSYCTPYDTALSKLIPNTFYKICTDSGNSGNLKQPICGNGSPFSFYVSKPTQKYDAHKRLIIEFSGGGACWDSTTCEYNANYLQVPDVMDNFVGRSCTEIQTGIANNNGNNGDNNKPINMLCSMNSFGGTETDLRAYTTIIVPYCTQDVHSGDNIMMYGNSNNDDDNDQDNDNDDDDESMQKVYHHGGHNLLAVLRYVYKNIPNPQHIILTGCSAGGTALPIAYRLLHRHYNRMFLPSKNTQISVLADSPVYLTPEYFLQNALPNWNTRHLVQKFIGFRKFTTYSQTTDYPTQLWDFVLRKGNNRDQWGFISHTDDPVSEKYYSWMSGNEDEERRKQQRKRRRLDEDVAEEWWSELSTSLTTIQSKHKNVHTYFMDGDDDGRGHCSFGLYYALQSEGFEEWAGNIVKEQLRRNHRGNHPGRFLVAVGFGVLLTWAAVKYGRRGNSNSILDDSASHFAAYHHDDYSDANETTATTNKKQRMLSYWKESATTWLVGLLQHCKTFPVTAGYTLAVTLYFWIMIISVGFTHPLNNPSLGPSAIGLSTFGINNPSLIFYKSQFLRLVQSSLLCSGVLTYAMTLLCLWHFVRRLETEIRNPRYFGLVSALMMLGPNLIYAISGSGASCSCLTCILGLNVFLLTYRVRAQQGKWLAVTITTILFSVLLVAIFPFNNWIMVLASLLLGGIIGVGLFGIEEASTLNGKVATLKLRSRGLQALLFIFFVMFMMLVFRRRPLRRPDDLYVEPFYTGCDLKYSDDIGDIASSFYGNDRRFLEDDESKLCAQFCVPHLVSNMVRSGVKRLAGLEVQPGTCEVNGYDYHLADKTYNYASYSLDVEVFTTASEDER